MRGSALRAEGNQTLRTLCAKCGRSISTEVGHAHPLEEGAGRATWGLVGSFAGRPKTWAVCGDCHDAGWRPPQYAEFP